VLEQGRRLQQLVQQAEQLHDPVARAIVHECLHSLLAFYGDGLARVLQVVQSSGTAGEHVYAELTEDPVVRGLLLIHGLHPLDLPTRLKQALDKVRPYMESHGGNVELLSLENDVARFRLQGACKTCPSSSVTMELALRRAIEEACPDLMGFEVETGQPIQS
jgi:Fe-S cluster biogenesis protein NfuA